MLLTARKEGRAPRVGGARPFFIRSNQLFFEATDEHFFHLGITEEEALNVIRIALVAKEDVSLLLLDAFNADLRPDRVAQFDRVLHQIAIELALQNVLYKYPIDLDQIAFKVFEEAQRRIARSEIVHRNLDPEVVEILELLIDELPIVNVMALRQLERDRRRINVVTG